MSIQSVRLTPAEQVLIQERRNKDCVEGKHLRGVTKLPNGRICHYCTNCLWAEATPSPIEKTGKPDFRIGSIDIIQQMKD